MSQSSYDNESQQSHNQERSYESEGEEQEHHQEQNSVQIRKKKEQLLQLEQKRIKAELKQISFGELLRYRDLKAQVGKTKKTKQIKKDRSKKQQPSERKDKNAPKQIKIMKRPPKTKPKQIFTSQAPKSIDPRFENYTGTYNQDLATKSYSFIQDIRNNEIQHIKKELKNKKIKQQNRQILLKNYNRITSDMKKFQHRQIEKKVRSEFKGNSNKFNVKERVIREHVQKAKLDALDDKSQDRRMKKKEKQIQKHKFIEKKQFMNSRK